MKHISMAVLMVVFAQSAFATSHGKLLDDALNANLAEKQQLQADHNETQARPKAIRGDKMNAKYQVIEVGDEMGSFAAARKVHHEKPVKKNAASAKELKDLNAEVSDSTL